MVGLLCRKTVASAKAAHHSGRITLDQQNPDHIVAHKIDREQRPLKPPPTMRIWLAISIQMRAVSRHRDITSASLARC